MERVGKGFDEWRRPFNSSGVRMECEEHMVYHLKDNDTNWRSILDFPLCELVNTAFSETTWWSGNFL